MLPPVRNIQFTIILLLQIAIILMLAVIMITNFNSKPAVENVYGLKIEDFDRINELNDKKNASEILQREIEYFRTEGPADTVTISIPLSNKLPQEAVDLMNKWYNADISEKEEIVKDLIKIIGTEPTVKELIKSLSELAENLKPDDPNF